MIKTVIFAPDQGGPISYGFYSVAGDFDGDAAYLCRAFPKAWLGRVGDEVSLTLSSAPQPGFTEAILQGMFGDGPDRAITLLDVDPTLAVKLFWEDVRPVGPRAVEIRVDESLYKMVKTLLDLDTGCSVWFKMETR